MVDVASSREQRDESKEDEKSVLMYGARIGSN